MMQRYSFSVRMMLVAALIFALGSYFIAANWRWEKVIATARADAPDGSATVALEDVEYRNIFGSRRQINVSLFLPAKSGKVAMEEYWHIGSRTESPIPADLKSLGDTAIVWDADSKGVTYQVTDQEFGRFERQAKHWARGGLASPAK